MTQKFHHPSQAKSSGLDEVFQIEFSKTCGPGQGPTCFQENNIKTPGGFRYIDVLRCCNCFWIGEMMPLDCLYIYIYTVCMVSLFIRVCMYVCVWSFCKYFQAMIRFFFQLPVEIYIDLWYSVAGQPKPLCPPAPNEWKQLVSIWYFFGDVVWSSMLSHH